MLGLAGRGSLCRVAECERDGRAPNKYFARVRYVHACARETACGWVCIHKSGNRREDRLPLSVGKRRLERPTPTSRT